MPSFAERIKIAIDTLRMKSNHDDGKVNFFFLEEIFLFKIKHLFSMNQVNKT